MVTYTVPGMKSDDAERVIKLLQDRLNAFNDRSEERRVGKECQ